MADVKQIFHDTTDDLLYAILQLIDGTVVIGNDGGFDVTGFVATLSCTSGIAQVIDIGTVPGGNDIATGIVITPDEWTDVSLGITNDPGTKWYVTGNNDLTIKIRR